jgi:hypothetical protein
MLLRHSARVSVSGWPRVARPALEKGDEKQKTILETKCVAPGFRSANDSLLFVGHSQSGFTCDVIDGTQASTCLRCKGISPRSRFEHVCNSVGPSRRGHFAFVLCLHRGCHSYVSMP